MRFRITVRGDNEGHAMELRGFIDVVDYRDLVEFSQAMEPFGLVIASLHDIDFGSTDAWTWQQ